ncbi:putative tRNA (cytosine-5-)-methyltransferase ncl1 protein [Rosellinia necatrix]|uniref:Putative tRNA (Cytosine-5-)-methyltransferase ncl1 protein n=1 Tax=Rosellinia necatrix TaxID=77044 RepID=A0A1S8A6T0_ROSNE|nr:putative tRNA (cytosine-5-)-methyltransferase ncl1 protein [Rosellinia necatrix]
MGGFDRVLLGLALEQVDPSVKTNKTEKDFITIPHTQKQLLLGAIDSVNHAGTGGFIVYSTCSVSVEENEMVVQYALKKRPNVRLVSTDLPFGKEGFTAYQGKTFDKSLSLTRRFYPHTLNLDGFYVAKFQKIGPTPASLIKDKVESTQKEREEVIDKTPILGDDKAPSQPVAGGDFGGFDEEEDTEYIQRAKRNAMRKRGLDPKSLEKPKAQDKAESDSSQAKVKSKSANGSKPKKTKSKA